MNRIDFNCQNLDLILVSNGNKYILNPEVNAEFPLVNKINRYRLEVSLACDLVCSYCVVHMNKVAQRGKLMSLEVAKNLVEKFNAEVGSSGSLMLIGGEPLLNWGVVKYIIDNCLGKVLLFTNALKLDEDKIKYLKKNNVLILTSLDGYTLQHNEARFRPRVEDQFNKVCHNIKNATKAGCELGVSCVVHESNIKDVKQIAEFMASQLGVKSLSFAYPHFTKEQSASDSFAVEEYVEALCQLLGWAKKNKIYIDQLSKILRGIFRREKIISACKVGVSQRAFYPDGTETLCTKLDTLENYEIEKFVGQLPINNPACQDCPALNLCGGGCPWDAALRPNSIGVDYRICKINKKLVDYILKDIAEELSNIDDPEIAKQKIKEVYEPLFSSR